MSVAVNFHHLRPVQVNHYPPGVATGPTFVSLTATDGENGSVCLFFLEGEHPAGELAAAEAWLRDALAKVEVAKIDAANAQPAPVLPPRVSNEQCGAELSRGIPGVDEVVWTCTRPAGHDGGCGVACPDSSLTAWGAALIGGQLGLTAGAL